MQFYYSHYPWTGDGGSLSAGVGGGLAVRLPVPVCVSVGVDVWIALRKWYHIRVTTYKVLTSCVTCERLWVGVCFSDLIVWKFLTKVFFVYFLFCPLNFINLFVWNIFCHYRCAGVLIIYDDYCQLSNSCTFYMVYAWF